MGGYDQPSSLQGLAVRQQQDGRGLGRHPPAAPAAVPATAGGSLIHYSGELTTRTANLITLKILWNSVVSTDDARYMCIDIKKNYLGTRLER